MESILRFLKQNLLITLLGISVVLTSACQSASANTTTLDDLPTPVPTPSRAETLILADVNEDVVESLAKLAEPPQTVVAKLPKKPGRRDAEYAHLFSGPVASAPHEPAAIEQAPAAIEEAPAAVGQAPAAVGQAPAAVGQEGHPDTLEQRVARLERQVQDLLRHIATDEGSGAGD